MREREREEREEKTRIQGEGGESGNGSCKLPPHQIFLQGVASPAQMAAVSLCSDWGTVERTMVMNNNNSSNNINLDIMNGGFYQQYTQPSMPLGLFGTSPSSWDVTDPLFLEHLLGGSPSPDDYLLPDTSSSTAAFPPELFPAASDELDVYGLSSFLFSTTPVDGVHSFGEPVFLPSFSLENPDAVALQSAAAGSGGYYVERSLQGSGVGCGGGGCPSAQSVAARQRRKRISEKTQELGQLVPGGSRMNTAEMLQAAFKHVKFLQAQLGILHIMRSSFQESPEGSPSAEAAPAAQLLPVLLASPAVQEKLAGEDRCIVPTCMARMLMEDQEIKSQPSICRDLGGLMASMD